MSVNLSDDFVLLVKDDQREVLLFEDSVFDWSDEQLREELRKIRPAYQLLCNLAAEENDPRAWSKIVYHSRRIDLKKTILENELVRREFR
ncbi:MAG TPA: hypothetical protein VN739_03405 [Nitrososphaerales archaeon]|nr:hypothetical protein [Nitrososphaerales archaeon]